MVKCRGRPAPWPREEVLEYRSLDAGANLRIGDAANPICLIAGSWLGSGEEGAVCSTASDARPRLAFPDRLRNRRRERTGIMFIPGGIARWVAASSRPGAAFAVPLHMHRGRTQSVFTRSSVIQGKTSPAYRAAGREGRRAMLRAVADHLAAGICRMLRTRCAGAGGLQCRPPGGWAGRAGS